MEGQAAGNRAIRRAPGAEAVVLKKDGAEETVWIGRKVLLDSRDINKAAIVPFNEIPPLLQLDLTEVGARTWFEMARQSGKRFAIFFNGELYSVFGVRSEFKHPPVVAQINVEELSVGKLWKVVNSLNREVAERTWPRK